MLEQSVKSSWKLNSNVSFLEWVICFIVNSIENNVFVTGKNHIDLKRYNLYILLYVIGRNLHEDLCQLLHYTVF